MQIYISEMVSISCQYRELLQLILFHLNPHTYVLHLMLDFVFYAVLIQ
jgi:hypothetical protein